MKHPHPNLIRSRVADALAKTARFSLAAACGLLVLVGLAEPGSAQSLALRYSFDEATGAAVDTSGKVVPANGTFSGTGTRTTLTPGGYPGAAFDAGSGGGGYIDAGDVDKLDGLQKLTVTAWIRLYGTPANGQVLLGKQDSPNTSGFAVLFGLPSGGAGVLGAGNFALKMKVGSTAASGISADLNADNAWIFVAATYDGSSGTSNLKFYNGGPATPIGSATSRNYSAGTALANTSPFRICASSSAAASVSVMVDDVRVYTNVLSQAQLETIRLANLPPTLWWDRSANTAGATNGPDGVASGVWIGSGLWSAANNWSSSSTGDFVTQQWSDGSVAVFAAGTDATGSYTVTVSNAPAASAINIEEGSVLFSRNSLTLTAGAAIDVASGASATFDTTSIDGTAGLTKTSAGTLTLNGAHTYSGATTVSNGTLFVNGSLPSANVTVRTDATLGGTGSLAGAVVVNTNGSVAPGPGAGLLTLQNGLDLSSGGTYVWELAANSTANPGTDFDQLAVTGGSLVLGGSSALSISFTGTATAPDAGNPFWQATRSWLIVSLSGTATNSGNANFASVSNAAYAAGNFSTSTDLAGQSVLTFVPSAAPPVFQSPSFTTTNLTLTWSAANNLNYQVQYNTNLNTTNWLVLTNITASGSTASVTDTIGSDPARFYRVVLLP
jgi:autotransporter-associated beta strand protein